MDAMRWWRTIAVALAGLAAGAPALLPVLAGLVRPAVAQARNSDDQALGRKRLILKDGSYQVVTKYQVKGDRVRYFSADREEWEEIPYNLIDWPATEKWNQTHAPGAKPAQSTGPNGAAQSGASSSPETAAEIDREEAAQRADEKARMPRVAPGLHLPDEDGIFVLDYFQSIPELIHLDQSQGNVNRDPSHNVLRAVIASFHGAQEPVRIAGQAARVRLHVNDPVLYVSLDTGGEQEAPESALMVNTHGANSMQDKNQYSSPDSRYAIVRVDVQPGERVIGARRISRVGQVQQDADIIPMTSEILPGKHWMKLTPKEPLDVGEYALMEILGPGVINLDVWDFGVSPNAPENRHPITPVKDHP